MFELITRLVKRGNSKSISIVLSPLKEPMNELEILRNLFKCGLSIYQLRRPNWTEKRVVSWIKKIPIEYRNRIILCQYPDLVLKYQLGGFHLPFNESAPEFSSVSISQQCFDYTEIDSRPKCEWSFLGPVFQGINIDKTIPHRTFGEFKVALTYLKQKFPGTKFIAFGGINQKNIHLCRGMGFDGFACRSAIWDTSSPEKAFKNLCKKW